MKLLLDTHTFIWWDSDPSNLSKRALQLLTDKDNLRLLSVVSLWEIQIKHQLGKLTLNKALDSLPMSHKDPFDRLLIAQTSIENAVLISCDSVFANYSVKVEW